jgi:hemolysin type calcium-binding protein
MRRIRDESAKASFKEARMSLRKALSCFSMIFALLVFPISPAIAATIANGGFETGNFSGWQVRNQNPFGTIGNWFVYSGTSSPLGSSIAAPPEGSFAATTDQQGPGSHILFQDVALEPFVSHQLSFFVYYENDAFGGFATPNSLDPTVSPNQQYRVDVLKATAAPFSMAAADILASVFRTKVGDPNSLAPTPISFDLSPFAGQTVRLRFAQVDNQDPFQASVDAVKITSGTATCTITGAGNILGTAGNDVICGSPGTDRISALGGNDLIRAGAGDDFIDAGSGNDRIEAGAGNDSVAGGNGVDQAIGGPGTDRCVNVETHDCELTG